ncbi:MAG TPA: endopeptidase La [Gammaproteobacteria bacterium]|nr:endopeptidase La [Gammaproteobacteria bacterium]
MNEELDAEIVSDDDQQAGSELAVPSDILPTTLHLLPVGERPFFPAQTVPVLLEDDPWVSTVEAVGETAHRLVGLAMIRKPNGKPPSPDDFHAVGTVVRIHHPLRSSGKLQFVAEGVQRFRIVRWLSREPPYLVRVEYPDEVLDDADQLRAYGIAIINTLKELVPLNPLYSEELKYFLNRFKPSEPSALTDFAASLTTASRDELQEILETISVLRRMEKVLVLIKKELEVARLQAQIRAQVEEKMSEQQRKFFLREQLKAIQQELGIAKDDRTADLERFRERLEDKEVPPTARERIDDEMQKLAVLESGSPEYSVTRNYLDWTTALPWGLYSSDNLDLDHARKVLDRDHDGLDDVKDRIIEFLAVGSLKGTVGGSIVLLVGPPGVGKTSIGHSVADTLGRKFYRFSLGGMRDEAEIKGHRRTYIGAMPGKFIQAIKEVGVANPVIMLDEVDKIGASFMGDPASALLEVLDPEQNAEFLDHYLDVRFDLSKVLFICTANQLDTIPSPLLDRMETIHLSGYITAEKLQIARNHLWPKLLERANIRKGRLQISDAALRAIIEGYAREAGVRNLEKRLDRIIRKAAVDFVKDKVPRLRVSGKTVEHYLGKPLFEREKPFTGIGVVTGLAWTPLGGATLNIEATRVHTINRGFKLTGKLGDVMRESADIAYSYVASHLKSFQGDPAFFDRAFVHLHVPEGATPKDGPSAGITMATALLSLARNQRIGRPLAMTGELTLTGQVLPVGGIREKVIAARRSRIGELILPAANKRDFDELPEHVREGLDVHFVSRYSEVAKLVFG